MSISAAVGFTACSDDEFNALGQVDNNTDMDMVSANGPALEPLGLTYQEFITAGDVQILNSDTTMISVIINSMNEEAVQKAVYEYYSKDAEMQAYMAKIRCRRQG